MLVDNNFDAEVLDREVIGLANLSPALRYLNTRILQMHDVAFSRGLPNYQSARNCYFCVPTGSFGHNYSSMFLATVVTMSCCRTLALVCCCRTSVRPGGTAVVLRLMKSTQKASGTKNRRHPEAAWHRAV